MKIKDLDLLYYFRLLLANFDNQDYQQILAYLFKLDLINIHLLINTGMLNMLPCIGF